MTRNWTYFLFILFALLALVAGNQLNEDKTNLDMIKGQVASLVSAPHTSYEEFYEKIGSLYRKFELVLNFALGEQVAHLSEEAKENVNILANGMRRVVEFRNNRKHDILQSKLIEGLLELLKKRAEPLNPEIVLDSAKGRQALEAKVKEVVWPICEQVLKEILPTIEVYDAFGNRDSVIERIDDFTIDWLFKGRSCQTILSDSEVIIEGAYIELYRENFLATHFEERKLLSEWMDLYDRIFNAKYEIESIKLLEYLKRMDEIFVKLEPLNLIEQSKFFNWQSSRKLIDFSYTSKAKCNLPYFYHISSARASNKVYPKTIAPFLKHYHIKQYEVCRPIFDDQLSKSLNRIYSSMSNIEALGVSVLKFGGFNREERKLPALGQKGIVKGSLEFLKYAVKSYNKARDKKFNSKKELKTSRDVAYSFEEEIVKPCEKVVKELGDVMNILNDIVLYAEIREKINQHTFDWIGRYQICYRITTNMKETLIKVQDEAMNSQKSEKKFLGCFK